ncbi:RICIN domain-containing protein [Streptomyces sp. NPDC002138]|uniref:RICIN domain-containing protein n=1 Tax=Streptomyces sp. NPDC002138 TaxID=3154410 RepID=UPI00331C6BC3
MFTPRPRLARISGLLAATAMAALGIVPATPAQAVTGPEATAAAYPYTVRLTLGDETNSRACTGSLVDRYWVLTAASCFASTPGGSVQPGKPALATTAVLGNGATSQIVEVVPRTDRDAALVRLAVPVTDVAPAALAPAAPASGAEFTAAGFGRTKTTWVPDRLHTGTFTLDASTATTLTLTGKGADVLCKGDTGGPLLNSANQLVAVNSRSWQGGCLGAPAAESRTGAVSARVDDLADWLRQVRFTTASLANGLSGKCVLVSWRTPDNLAPATQVDCMPQYVDQIWKITPVDGGNYQIRNALSNRCLYVPWQTPDNGAAAVQVDCDAKYIDQVWKITPVDGGTYQIRNLLSNRCLYVPWQTPDNGAAVRQVDCDAKYIDQVWKI